QDFPQPSPAACGKRKVAELTAAQILVGSANLEMEGANVLSAMRGSGSGGAGLGTASKAPKLELDAGHFMSNTEEDVKKRVRPLSLSINFPDGKYTDPAYEGQPGTPWDSQ